MSYHIVNIDSPQCSISCRDGQLVCKTADSERKLPLEDVAAIIITSFSASIHSHLFLQAAKHGVALILCEAFKPASLVLPARRATDTLLCRAQIALSEHQRAALWQKTIEAKCQNQLALAESLAPRHERLPDLRTAARSRKPHKESFCARYYWQILGSALNTPDFNRGRHAGSWNNLLNYGYAVLLSATLQKLFALGLDPTFGISHATRERSTPLAYDLMEPFRPCVDWRVIQWMLNHPHATAWEVTKEFRQWVTGFAIERVEYLGFNLDIHGCLEGVIRGFRRAVVEKQTRYYRPWLTKNGFAKVEKITNQQLS
ncbi:type II CRISPR-associated endonuclease Cas1 [Fontisphaera persica]|uniref:type II CRISPR-associated endonuclease Cas1 n=1 Tax=Fontisphaera persica TaxID=2974023 RepID=UPI0024C0DC67|nr:type II CRISPR-associated endonuclease Cas1 [Fontisphaera persica]WCJ57867.1 type II CRISPR-associated endonuclease Cas1 [Fontisphaera persica]